MFEKRFKYPTPWWAAKKIKRGVGGIYGELNGTWQKRKLKDPFDHRQPTTNQPTHPSTWYGFLGLTFWRITIQKLKLHFHSLYENKPLENQLNPIGSSFTLRFEG